MLTQFYISFKGTSGVIGSCDLCSICMGDIETQSSYKICPSSQRWTKTGKDH